MQQQKITLPVSFYNIYQVIRSAVWLSDRNISIVNPKFAEYCFDLILVYVGKWYSV